MNVDHVATHDAVLAVCRQLPGTPLRELHFFEVPFYYVEYGIAQLSGKSIYQRVMELAQIAHPKFREDLIRAAKTRHYIFADQMPLPDERISYGPVYQHARGACIRSD